MKKMLAFLALFLIVGPLRPAAAATNPILSAICTNVDCLNNFTAKTGYSFSQKQVMTGGYTDLERTWYVSPGPGFEVPINPGPTVQTPFLDLNVVFKAGQLMSDKIPYVHNMVNSDPFITGLLKYSTIGESGSWDYTNHRFIDLTWAGFTVNW